MCSSSFTKMNKYYRSIIICQFALTNVKNVTIFFMIRALVLDKRILIFCWFPIWLQCSFPCPSSAPTTRRNKPRCPFPQRWGQRSANLRPPRPSHHAAPFQMTPYSIPLEAWVWSSPQTQTTSTTFSTVHRINGWTCLCTGWTWETKCTQWGRSLIRHTPPPLRQLTHLHLLRRTKMYEDPNR